jgi:hypothetical protein
MDQQELIITFLGSFLIAFLAAISVVAIEKWWKVQCEFQDNIKGLISEIEINFSRLEELKETISSNLRTFEEVRRAGGVFNLPPLILLDASFDYCRIRGTFSTLPEDIRTKINDLYVLSQMITVLVDRDFQLSLIDSDNPTRLYSNKKKTWEAIITIIDRFKTRKQEIDFQKIIKNKELF